VHAISPSFFLFELAISRHLVVWVAGSRR